MSSDRELADETRHHPAPQRDAEDAAAVIAVLAALSAEGAERGTTSSPQRSIWTAAHHAARHVTEAPGPHTWWASGLPR